MRVLGSKFTPLEQAVLRAICEMNLTDRPALESQLATATLISRENTGAGFYTKFAVERARGAPIEGERFRNGPPARIDGLKHGMGFILWLGEGYPACLEGFSYDESTVAIDLEGAGFEIARG